MLHVSPAQQDAFQLGDWTVFPTEGELARSGERVRLQPKVMEILVVLALNRGRVVSRDELLASVWDGTFVEEGALSQSMHALRKALGDDARKPRYVETVPRRGYRLIVEVVPTAPAPSGRAQRRAPKPLITIAAVLPVTALAIWWISGPTPEDRPAPPSAGVPALAILPLAGRDVAESIEDVRAGGLGVEIQRELLSSDDLRLISRLSIGSMAGRRRDQIARDLGADYALDLRISIGPAERNAVTPRLEVELVEVADNTSRLLLEFDLAGDGLSEISGEVATAVRAALGLNLPEQAPLSVNADAYALFLEGVALLDPVRESNVEFDLETSWTAVERLRASVAADPGYPLAWAELCRVLTMLYANGERTGEVREASAGALAEAIALAPRHPEVRLAEAYFAYRIEDDYDRALAAFQEVVRAYPHDPNARLGAALVLRRRGDLAAAVGHFLAVFELDRQDVNIATILAKTYNAQRLYEKSDRWSEFTLRINPNLPQVVGDRAMNRLAWDCSPETIRRGQCSTRGAQAILDQARPSLDRPGYLAFFDFILDSYDATAAPPAERPQAYRQALRRLAGVPEGERNPQDDFSLYWRVAYLHRLLGEEDEARRLALERLEPLRQRVAEQPREAMYSAYLGITHALLGRREEALEHTEAAIEMSSRDRYSGPRKLEFQAFALMLLGEHESALDRLEELASLEYQYAITPAHLRLEPVWQPLRGNPRFEALFEEGRFASGSVSSTSR